MLTHMHHHTIKCMLSVLERRSGSCQTVCLGHGIFREFRDVVFDDAMFDNHMLNRVLTIVT